MARDGGNNSIREREQLVLGRFEFIEQKGLRESPDSDAPRKDRQEQMRTAQIKHRSRSKNYMLSLEDKVEEQEQVIKMLRDQLDRATMAAEGWEKAYTVTAVPAKAAFPPDRRAIQPAPGFFIWTVSRRLIGPVWPGPSSPQTAIWEQLMTMLDHRIGIPNSIGFLSGEEVYWLRHFNDHITPTLDVTDMSAEGYAQLVFPLAWESKMLRSAILCASMAHVEMTQYSRVSVNSLRCRAEAIEELKLASHGPPVNAGPRLSILATILMLLINGMICGQEDFREWMDVADAWDRIRFPFGDSHMEITTRRFILEQIQMLRSFARPVYQCEMTILSGRDESSEALNERIAGIFTRQLKATTLASELANMPPLSPMPDGATELDPMAVRLHEILETLVELVKSIPPHSFGEDSLIYVCGIAASKSVLPYHKAFFTGEAASVLQRLGYNDIPGILAQYNAIT